MPSPPALVVKRNRGMRELGASKAWIFIGTESGSAKDKICQCQVPGGTKVVNLAQECLKYVQTVPAEFAPPPRRCRLSGSSSTLCTQKPTRPQYQALSSSD